MGELACDQTATIHLSFTDRIDRKKIPCPNLPSLSGRPHTPRSLTGVTGTGSGGRSSFRQPRGVSAADHFPESI
jgi:hypothetical protein